MDMVMVLFRVTVKEGAMGDYRSMSQALRAHLQEQPGFLGSEGFVSGTDPNTLLGINYWENEAYVDQWRNRLEHRRCQQRGREEFFVDYRVTVGQVLRSYTGEDRIQAPDDSKEYFK